MESPRSYNVAKGLAEGLFATVFGNRGGRVLGLAETLYRRARLPGLHNSAEDGMHTLLLGPRLIEHKSKRHRERTGGQPPIVATSESHECTGAKMQRR